MPLVDIRSCRVYLYCIWYTYCSIQHMYLFLMQSNWKRLTSMVFGTVHSDMTVVVLLHKHFSSWLSTYCNSISVIMYCTYATVSESKIMPFFSNSFTFFKLAYYVCCLFSTDCLSPIFHLDCTRWCRFTLLTHIGKKSQCSRRENLMSHLFVSLK